VNGARIPPPIPATFAHLVRRMTARLQMRNYSFRFGVCSNTATFAARYPRLSNIPCFSHGNSSHSLSPLYLGESERLGETLFVSSSRFESIFSELFALGFIRLSVSVNRVVHLNSSFSSCRLNSPNELFARTLHHSSISRTSHLVGTRCGMVRRVLHNVNSSHPNHLAVYKHHAYHVHFHEAIPTIIA
jgi:hypothetical protein